MTLPAFLFVFLALVLFFLLAWATRPPRFLPLSEDQIFEVLTHPRHCSRVHIILQSLQPEDTDFLARSGNHHLMRQLRSQRRRIALRYLDLLEVEFETLLEASRRIALKTPEVIPMEEMARWKLSLLFSLQSLAIRWRLKFGLWPAADFTALHALATGIIRQLEIATSRITENALASGNLPEYGRSATEGD